MDWRFSHDVIEVKSIKNKCSSLLSGNEFLSRFLHALLDDLVVVYRQNSKHETCSILGLVNFGTNFSLFGAV